MGATTGTILQHGQPVVAILSCDTLFDTDPTLKTDCSQILPLCSPENIVYKGHFNLRKYNPVLWVKN